MRKRKSGQVMTEVVDCAPTQAPSAAVKVHETAFEKRRGVSWVEVRDGFALVHITNLADPIHHQRMSVLRAIANIPVSIDFLKLTSGGLAFVAREESAAEIKRMLDGLGVTHTVDTDRSIVLVHAVNIRDEEGLIARIIREVIQSGVAVDHIGDMHDRLLMVLNDAEAHRMAKHFEETLVEGRHAH